MKEAISVFFAILGIIFMIGLVIGLLFAGSIWWMVH